MVGEASAMRRNGWRRGRYDVAKSRRTHARLGRRIGERNREQANVRNRPRLREGSMTISRKRSAGSPPLKDRLGEDDRMPPTFRCEAKVHPPQPLPQGRGLARVDSEVLRPGPTFGWTSAQDDDQLSNL